MKKQNKEQLSGETTGLCSTFIGKLGVKIPFGQ